MENKTKLLLLSAGSTVALVVVQALIFRPISQFAELFESFESDVPLITAVVLFTYKTWWIFPVTTFLLGVDVLRRKSFSAQYSILLFRVFLGGFILAVFMYFLASMSMYYGVFLMKT